MDLDRIYEILSDSTSEFRKGEAVTRKTIDEPVLVESQAGAPVGVERRTVLEITEIFSMPHKDDIDEKVWEPVDLHFVIVGVNRAKAKGYAEELRQILADYPEPDRLASGPSYIEIGGVLGDQSVALRLFALGKVAGFWDVITPATFGLEGEDADRAAGAGYVMCSGLR